MVVKSYIDPVTNHILIVTGLIRRVYRMIYDGMLLQVRIVIFDPREILIAIGAPQWKIDRSDHEFPDLANMFHLEEFPRYDEEELRDYMHEFTKTVIPLLNLEQESVDYIWENLEPVTDFLVEKLMKGHLRFYKKEYGKGPEDNAAIVFGDFSVPEAPTFLYPAFGLKMLSRSCDPFYTPWKPCHLRPEWSLVKPRETKLATSELQPIAIKDASEKEEDKEGVKKVPWITNLRKKVPWIMNLMKKVPKIMNSRKKK